ncbi:MAG: hypothetical protein AB1486_03260 [Planctomycetota bacterium]
MALALVLLLSCIGLELLYRGVRLLQGRPYDAEETATLLKDARGALDLAIPEPGLGNQEAADKVRRNWSLHPYFGWQYSEFLQPLLQYLQQEHPPSEFTVFFLGGSVSVLIYRLGKETISSALLADSRFQGKTITFLCGGSGGYKQPQQVMLLAFLLGLGFDPDVVINIDGLNEVATGSDNSLHDMHPIMPSWQHMRHLVNVGANDPELLHKALASYDAQAKLDGFAQWALRLGLNRLSVTGELCLARLREMQNECYRAHRAYLDGLMMRHGEIAKFGLEFRGSAQDAMPATLTNWYEGSRSLHALCQCRSIHYLHILQPALHDEGSKPLTESERARSNPPGPGWSLGARIGYPLLREKGKALAECGISFRDCSMIFSETTEPIYVDDCHYNENGCQMVAQEIARALLESLPP